jgi:hypothetical protein
VDIEQEGFEALWALLEGFDADWAQTTSEIYSAEAMQEAVRFWAVDPEPAGIGYATINITSQSQIFPIKAEDLCTLMPAVYEQLGVEMIDAKCGLEINGLDAARFLILLEMGPLAIKEYQYVYVREDAIWTLTFGVDATKWSEYKPVFAKSAKSFRLD